MNETTRNEHWMVVVGVFGERNNACGRLGYDSYQRWFRAGDCSGTGNRVPSHVVEHTKTAAILDAVHIWKERTNVDRCRLGFVTVREAITTTETKDGFRPFTEVSESYEMFSVGTTTLEGQIPALEPRMRE